MAQARVFGNVGNPTRACKIYFNFTFRYLLLSVHLSILPILPLLSSAFYVFWLKKAVDFSIVLIFLSQNIGSTIACRIFLQKSAKRVLQK